MIDEDNLPIMAQHWLTMESATAGEIQAEANFHQFQWMVEPPPLADYSRSNREIREWHEWCRNNVRGLWSSTSSLMMCAFFFSERTDAMLFVLTHSGQLVDLRPYLSYQP